MAADIVIGSRSAGSGTKLHKTLMKTDRTALAFASGDTVKSFTINANALTHTIVLEMSGFSGANPTATLSVENSDSVEIYSNSGMAENADHVMAAEKPLVGDNTIKVTLSEDPLSDGTAHVSLYLRGE
ncbi:MAG: hypothetical protein KAV87_30570 [Desulfobacteraceae bacterium]|nr:hypothetical protein [Desulfobacteraceae bacterium]